MDERELTQEVSQVMSGQVMIGTHNLRARRLVDICTTLLSQDRSFRRRAGKWLTTDVRANLEDASSWCDEIVHCNQETLRGTGVWLESLKVRPPFMAAPGARLIVTASSF